MKSYIAPFHTLRLRAAHLLARVLTRTPILKDRLPAPHPSTAPQDLYRIWVCMKNRTDGRPCCAAGNGHGTAAELLAALQAEIARATQADPTLAGRLDARPSGCLDLCDHALVAIAHTGPAATRSKPPNSKLDRILHPRLAQFTNLKLQDAPDLLQLLLSPKPPQR